MLLSSIVTSDYAKLLTGLQNTYRNEKEAEAVRMNKMLIICLVAEQISQLTGSLNQQLEINFVLYTATEKSDMSDHSIYLNPDFSQLQCKTHSAGAQTQLTSKYIGPGFHL